MELSNNIAAFKPFGNSLKTFDNIEIFAKLSKNKYEPFHNHLKASANACKSLDKLGWNKFIESELMFVLDKMEMFALLLKNRCKKIKYIHCK